jgi:hypothetical protein
MEYGRSRNPVPETLKTYGREHICWAITEANLGLLDTEIARMRYIDGLAHADIGAAVGYDRTTVSRHLKAIEPRIRSIAQRIPQ